jgi:transposase
LSAKLGVPAQSIFNWVRTEQDGRLSGAGVKPVSAEQIEPARLHVEVAPPEDGARLSKNAACFAKDLDVKYA